MMILLSKREYDDLVRRATAAEAIAEEKAESFKADILERLRDACKNTQVCTVQTFADRIMDILKHY